MNTDDTGSGEAVVSMSQAEAGSENTSEMMMETELVPKQSSSEAGSGGSTLTTTAVVHTEHLKSGTFTQSKSESKSEKDSDFTTQTRLRNYTVNPSDPNYIQERQPEIARQKQTFDLFRNGRYLCLAVLVLVLGISELVKLSSNSNTKLLSQRYGS